MDANFDEIRAEAARLVAEALDTKSIDNLKTCYKIYHKPERDVKAPFDQAFRDVLLQIVGDAAIVDMEAFISLSIEACRSDLVYMSLPAALLADMFDLLTLTVCADMFHYVERHVGVWKEELFFGSCKNTLLRMCNDLLRRISKTHEMIFCGRILLFLAKFFPFSERSGLNIVSEFNLENVTAYDVEDRRAAVRASTGAAASASYAADHNLYCKFWGLQDFFRNPAQCYEKAQWKVFAAHTSSLLSAFGGMRIDQQQAASAVQHAEFRIPARTNELHTPNFFAKYLTNQRLLDLQLFDVNFRRSILLQLLIVFQYLTTSVRFKAPTVLTISQKHFVTDAKEKAHALLRDTPPDGAAFDAAVSHILQREQLWNTWKNNGCPDFRSSLAPPSGHERIDLRALGQRLPLGELVRQAHARKEFFMAKTELTQLWNLSADNLAACRSQKRDFLPAIDAYFPPAEGARPALSASLRDPKFTWRALRLLSRRSPYFFVQETTTFTHIHDYMDFALRRIQEEKKAEEKAESAAAIEEPDEDEEMEDEDEAEEEEEGDEAQEEDLFKQADEAEGEFQVQNILPFRVTVMTVSQFHKICSSLQTHWIPLAQKLGYNNSEINDIKSAKTDAFEQTTSLLNLWFEEDDDSTLENFQYILESLQLVDAAHEVKVAINQNKNLKTESSTSNE